MSGYRGLAGGTDRRGMVSGRPCHEWHWLDCDRPRCPRDGAEHVEVPGHERPLYLCRQHAIEARANTGEFAR